MRPLLARRILLPGNDWRNNFLIALEEIAVDETAMERSKFGSKQVEPCSIAYWKDSSAAGILGARKSGTALGQMALKSLTTT